MEKNYENNAHEFWIYDGEELIWEAEKIKINIDDFFKLNKTTFKSINYDLIKMMIICGKEEIQALVYNANKKVLRKKI